MKMFRFYLSHQESKNIKQWGKKSTNVGTEMTKLPGLSANDFRAVTMKMLQ